MFWLTVYNFVFEITFTPKGFGPVIFANEYSIGPSFIAGAIVLAYLYLLWRLGSLLRIAKDMISHHFSSQLEGQIKKRDAWQKSIEELTASVKAIAGSEVLTDQAGFIAKFDRLERSHQKLVSSYKDSLNEGFEQLKNAKSEVRKQDKILKEILLAEGIEPKTVKRIEERTLLTWRGWGNTINDFKDRAEQGEQLYGSLTRPIEQLDVE